MNEHCGCLCLTGGSTLSLITIRRTVFYTSFLLRRFFSKSADGTLLRGRLISKDKFISRQKSKKKQLSADLGPRGVTASLWNCNQPRPGSRETKLQSPCSIKSKLAGDDELQMWEARRGKPCTGRGFLPADLQLSEARRAPRLHPQSGLWLESWCYALDEDGLEI